MDEMAIFTSMKSDTIDLFSSNGYLLSDTSQSRIVVRTCNGLELRDSSLYTTHDSASRLVDCTTDADIFPSLVDDDDFPSARFGAAAAEDSGMKIYIYI